MTGHASAILAAKLQAREYNDIDIDRDDAVEHSAEALRELAEETGETMELVSEFVDGVESPMAGVQASLLQLANAIEASGGDRDALRAELAARQTLTQRPRMAADGGER